MWGVVYENADVTYTPGYDHAGIATQTQVERQLYADRGLRRCDVDREEFLQMCRDWKNG